jgi:hypothetical protein
MYFNRNSADNSTIPPGICKYMVAVNPDVNEMGMHLLDVMLDTEYRKS